MLEDPVRNHDDIGVAHTWWERRAGDDLDLRKRFETVGQMIVKAAGEPLGDALMPELRPRRHGQGPLAEFPPSRRVKFERIPLLEGQQPRRDVGDVRHRAPPFALRSVQITRDGRSTDTGATPVAHTTDG